MGGGGVRFACKCYCAYMCVKASWACDLFIFIAGSGRSQCKWRQWAEPVGECAVFKVAGYLAHSAVCLCI